MTDREISMTLNTLNTIGALRAEYARLRRHLAARYNLSAGELDARAGEYRRRCYAHVSAGEPLENAAAWLRSLGLEQASLEYSDPRLA